MNAALSRRCVATLSSSERFSEHTIEGEEDCERHFDCVHYAPVKHGQVRCLNHR